MSTTKTSETGTTIAELQASRDRYNTAAAAAAHNLAEAAKGAAEAISQGASAVGAMAEIHFLTGIVEAKWAMARALSTLIHDKRTDNDHGNRP